MKSEMQILRFYLVGQNETLRVEKYYGSLVNVNTIAEMCLAKERSQLPRKGYVYV